ncbi:MAG: DUF4198 domain-containing protein [Flavobacteriaceae bacterium]|nr:DUF4198 domain-containing protein [Flavobacteriaceae bacterium]
MNKFFLALVCVFLFSNHDMYLKMETYFLEANQMSSIQLFNGTFEKSENTIDRSRMLDASLLGNNNRYKIKEGQWSEKDSITFLSFNSGESATWVVGVSTKPRNIEMNAKSFNDYLEHDGVKDILAQRKKNNTLNNDAVEKYSKHVKAIFQVGENKTDDWSKSLGYPIEFIPLENPYLKYTGDTIQIKLLRNGKPLVNQLVYADFKSSKHGHTHNETNVDKHTDKTHNHTKNQKEEHSKTQGKVTHTHDGSTHTHEVEKKKDTSEKHSHTSAQELRTDKNGVVSVNLTNDGIWYLRTIHLENSTKKGLTHESNWATLTFEVKHSHNNNTSHTHTHEEGISSTVFWLSSIVLILILFIWFNRKSDKSEAA